MSHEYRDEIDVLVFTQENVYGEVVMTWQDEETEVPATVRYESETERIRNGRNETTQAIIVEIRDEIDITAENRIRFEDEIWVVSGPPRFIDPERRKKRFTAIISE